ncbi:MAG: hypothetical protein Q8918_04215 [Bacteroidota bacterium]|nr:hypothetical protein [Bacteroidota bacterium]MDP4212086.1 hypothetical protein [Bacteroidota bacterium]MDP4249299.1 hypothetical protein [Bacteroidota bacterium]
MKHLYILVLIALVSFTGCTVYRSNPTPDDVYYSPGAPAENYASADNNNDQYYSAPNENYVRMRVEDPNRWSYFDDYNYDYYGGYSAMGYASPYSMGYGFGMGYGPFMGGFGYYSPFSFWNSYYAWNSFYNPYYGGVVYVNGKNFSSPAYTRLSTFNPAGYQGRSYSSRPNSANRFYNGNTPVNNSSRNFRRSYNNTNNSNYSRPTYSRPTYSRPMNQSSQPVRSTPSNFGGGGGSGGSMRGGGGSRPAR